jgi:methionine synthase II (cobalamin-independent)
LKVPPIATNLVGSFPLEDNRRNFKRALDDQIESSLDYISYPQLADMNEMFLEPLVDDSAVIFDGGRYVVTQEFDPRPRKEVRRWVEDAREILRRKGTMPLKACVTGPFTLASNLEVSGSKAKPFPGGYVDLMTEHPWVIEKLTEYVRRICINYSSLSEIVSVDEPYLSIIVGRRKNLLELGMSPAQASDLLLESLDRPLSAIRTHSSIHVCGGIGQQLAESLLETEAEILSHEFSGTERNFEAYDPSQVEGRGKILSVGVVSTSPTEDEGGSEPVGLIRKRMECAIERYGAERLMFSPDCGFRPLGGLLGEEAGYQLSIRKIRGMVEARKELAMEMGFLTEEKTGV